MIEGLPLLLLAFAITVAWLVWRGVQRAPPPPEFPAFPPPALQETAPAAALPSRAATEATTLAHAQRTFDGITGPAPALGRWHIRYSTIDENGNDAITVRTIRIMRVRPVKMHLECWCELRREERTFSLYGIEDAVDAGTGAVVDLETWLRDYRRSRRQAGNPTDRQDAH